MDDLLLHLKLCIDSCYRVNSFVTLDLVRLHTSMCRYAARVVLLVRSQAGDVLHDACMLAMHGAEIAITIASSLSPLNTSGVWNLLRHPLTWHCESKYAPSCARQAGTSVHAFATLSLSLSLRSSGATHTDCEAAAMADEAGILGEHAVKCS